MMDAVSSSGSPVSEDFELETRFVVLSYLGLVPANILDQSFSSRGTSSDEALPDATSRGSHSKQSSDSGQLSSLPEFSLKQKVDRLTQSEDEDDTHYYEYVENGTGKRTEDTADMANVIMKQSLDDHLKDQLAMREIEQIRPFQKYRKSVDNLARQASDAKSDGIKRRESHEDYLRKRLSKSYPFSAQRPNSFPTNLQGQISVDGNEVNSSPGRSFSRMESKVSEGSEVTVPMSLLSERSSYVDVQQIQLDPYVKTKMLPPTVVPLKRELENEFKDLREDFDNAHPTLSSSPCYQSAGTPCSEQEAVQAEVARYLCVLGDRVQEEYRNLFEDAFNTVMQRPVEDLTYSDLQHATERLVGRTTGWTKVALLLQLSKRLTYGMLSHGPSSITKLTRYTAQLIEDSAAEFIVSKGGWHAITELDAETPITPADIYMAFADPYSADQYSSVDEGTLAGESPLDIPDASVKASTSTADQPIIKSKHVRTEVEIEAMDNVQRISADMPLWRQKSREYDQEVANERIARYNAERRLWRYLASVAVCVGVVAMVMWKRYGNRS